MHYKHGACKLANKEKKIPLKFISELIKVKPNEATAKTIYFRKLLS